MNLAILLRKLRSSKPTLRLIIRKVLGELNNAAKFTFLARLSTSKVSLQFVRTFLPKVGLKGGLSVVIPVHNTAEYLPQLLTSIEMNNIKPDDLEIIFILSNCNDNSLEILSKWRKKIKQMIFLNM